MAGLLVAGIGSAYGADRLGWDVVSFVAAQVAEQKQWVTTVDVVCVYSPATMLGSMGTYTHVICVDALRSESHSYGALLEVKASALEGGQELLSSHGVGLASTLQLGFQLNLLPNDCIVMGLNVHPFEARPVSGASRDCLARAVLSKIDYIATS